MKNGFITLQFHAQDLESYSNMSLIDFYNMKENERKSQYAAEKSIKDAKLKVINDMVGKIFLINFNDNSYRVFVHDTPLKVYSDTVNTKTPIICIMKNKSVYFDSYTYVQSEWLVGMNVKSCVEITKKERDVIVKQIEKISLDVSNIIIKNTVI